MNLEQFEKVEIRSFSSEDFYITTDFICELPFLTA